jgi:lipopolysaccharide biosynthesis protein
MLLVHMHVFYPAILPELLGRLENIRDVSFDLFVTISSGVENNQIREQITRSFPDATIQIVENRGYDIGPFCHVLNQVSLNDYRYILKLHTKRNVDGAFVTRFFLNGKRWRRKLLRPLDSEKVFKNCINAFEVSDKVGMLADLQLLKPLYLDCEQLKRTVKTLTRKMKILYSEKYLYVAGTMFLARANVFIPLQNLRLVIEDFELGKSVDNNSLAHAVERVMGILVYSQGYIIEDCLTPRCIQKWIRTYDKLVTYIMKGSAFC